MLVLLGLGGGCGSAPQPPPVSLPEHYDGEAFSPSAFVARPICVSEPFDPGRDGNEFLPERVGARLEYVVGADGRVLAARVLETNHPRLAAGLLRWLATARFVPGQKEGRAVPVRMEFPYWLGPSRMVEPDR